MLNFFTNWSKVEEQEGRIHAFNGKFGPKIMANWCCHGSDLNGSWEWFPFAASWLPDWHWMSHDFASKEPRSRHDRATIAPRLGHDRAAIGPRSYVDRALDSQTNIIWWSWHWFCDEGATIVARSHHDRGSIAPRLWISCTSLPRRRMEIWRSMRLYEEKKIELHVAVRSRSRGLDVDEDKLSSCRHVATDEKKLCPRWAESPSSPVRWRSDDRDVSTRQQVSPSISSVYSPIEHVLMMEIRWTPRPSHQRTSITAHAFDVRRAATCPAKVRTVWEHSLTRKKKWQW